jgi:ArsR family transcriptional regulator
MKKAVQIFKALSDPTRLRIILLLLQRDLCVCELLFILDMEQSRISHQLRLLRDAGLVEDIREGKWIIYKIPPGIKTRLRRTLSTFAEELGQSEEITKDRENLTICVNKGIRKSRKKD